MNEKTLEAFVELRLKGHKELFYTEPGGLEFIYRPLCFYEYDSVLQLEEYLSGPEINDHIVKTCHLYPNIDEWLDTCKAVEPDNYAEEILNNSGWQDSKKMLELLVQGKEESAELPALIELAICTVFKSVSPEQVRAMTLKEQMGMYAKAEVLYGATGSGLDMEAMLKQEVNKKAIMPVPAGMQSTDPGDFDMPDLDKILSGRETY